MKVSLVQSGKCKNVCEKSKHTRPVDNPQEALLLLLMGVGASEGDRHQMICIHPSLARDLVGGGTVDTWNTEEPSAEG